MDRQNTTTPTRTGMAALGALPGRGDQTAPAQSLSAEQGFAEHIEQWVQSDICEMPQFRDGEFDAVVAYGGRSLCLTRLCRGRRPSDCRGNEVGTWISRSVN